MAFAPGRLAMLSVTAGSSSGAEARGRAVPEEHVVRRLLRAVHDLGDFAQIDRPAAEHADHHVAHVLRAGEERAGFDHDLLIVGRSGRPRDTAGSPAAASARGRPR